MINHHEVNAEGRNNVENALAMDHEGIDGHGAASRPTASQCNQSRSNQPTDDPVRLQMQKKKP